jgi:hypothetical protein
MDAKEIRLRCIEAIASGGMREARRLIKDAEELAEWVEAAEEQAEPAPRRGRPTSADKG